MGNDNVMCIYHGNCADGFGAAYAVWRAFGEQCEYVPGHYGKEPPDVTGKVVYMVDFSYKRPVLLEMAEQAESIVILDHHDTAEKELVDLPDNVHAIFDQSKSGAVLAWEYMVGAHPPYLLQIVQDRDLWRFHLPETKAVTAFLFSQEWTFLGWHAWAEHAAIKDLAAKGAVLLQKQDKEVAALTEDNNVMWVHRFPVSGNGKEMSIPAVNCPWMFASDVGYALCKKYPEAPFSITFLMNDKDVKFSLRADNDDVHCGAIAGLFGGGGHPRAAGFSITHAEFASTLVVEADDS